MSVFNQQGQRVNTQYNAAGNINFGNVTSKADAVNELQKIQKELEKASQSGAINEEIAIDIESNIKKATVQAKKRNPEKAVIVGYIDKARKLLESVPSMTGLVKALTEAIQVIGALF
jgi:hypothetical protein